MKNSFSAKWVATLLAASLVTLPAAAQQAQQQAPSQQQPASDPSSPTDQQTGQQAPAQSTDPKPIPQKTNPSVKPGSEADVSAIGNRNVGKGLDFYSLEREIALGKQLAQEVDKTAKFINDPVITEYVNRVAQNLVRNSDARVPFTIKVVDSDVVNAFALPGGFFYVNSGLILHADEESELAGVMAHEIAHVCARHGTKQATKGEIVNLASIPAMIFIPYTWAGYAIYQGMNFAIPLTFLKFSRDDEREADYLGLQYMYKAGYDPNSFVAFFEKVEADEKKTQMEAEHEKNPTEENALYASAAKEDVAAWEKIVKEAHQKIVDSFKPDDRKAYDAAVDAYKQAWKDMGAAIEEERASSAELGKLEKAMGVK